MLVWAVVALAGGILLEAELGGGPLAWHLAAGAAGAVAIVTGVAGRGRAGRAGTFRGGASLLAALAAFVAAGGGLAVTERTRLVEVTASPPREAVFEGVVARPVTRARAGRQVVVAVDGWIAADAVHPWRARVRVHDDGDTPLLPGDRIRFSGTLRVPRGYRNEGAFDLARLLHARGLEWVATARAPGIVRVDAPPASGPWRAAGVARARAADALAAGGGGDGAALVAALAVGERAALGEPLEDSFRRAGVTHVLSVSGLHLAAVALLLDVLARRLWTLVPWLAVRFPAGRAAAILALGGAAFYTLVTGAEVATVRALGCAAIVLGGRALGRRPDAAAALAVAALAILVASPWALHDPSFQLSFAAAAALVALGARSRGVPPPPRRLARIARAARGLILASAAATVATAPLTALHHGVVQPAGVVTNALVVPIAELVILPLGLAAAAVGVAVPVAGAPLAAVAAWLAERVIALVVALARFAPVLEVPPPRPLALMAIVAAALVALAPGWRAARRGIAVALAAVALAAWLLPAAPPGELRVTFLDVGQGDATLIETPGGERWLVDAGGRLFEDADAPGGRDPGEHAIWPFLRARRIERLDVVVITHPHPDHHGGLPALLSRVAIGEVWITGDDPGHPRWHALLDELRARGVPVRRPPLGAARERHGVRLVVLGPDGAGDGRAAARPDRSVNDGSLVLRIEHAGRAILLPGDVEAAGEADLVARVAGALAADVVKVPHHGSRTSSTPAFVAAARAALAVVSCGASNRFGFPAPVVVARWSAAGARVLRTDMDGAVSVRIAADGTLRVTRAVER